MAKPPNKTKSDAPAQFDMNSRDRKGGGKGGPRGPGRGREERRPPSNIVSLPPSVVDRGQGWVIRKIGKVDQTSRTAAGAVYELIFDGHDPLMFDFLGAARERAKEPPPEKPVAASAGETVDESGAVVDLGVAEEPSAAPEAETTESPGPDET